MARMFARSAVALLLVSLIAPTARAVQSPREPGATVGVLIVAHGGGDEWNAQVGAVAREVHWPGPIGVSFLMGPGAATGRFQDVANDLVRRGAHEIVVIPMLVSSHSGHYEQVRYLAGETDSLDDEMLHHLEMSGITGAATGVPLRLARAMDDAPEVAVALAARAQALATDPAAEAVFMVGHGPGSSEAYAAWMDNLRRVADAVRTRGGFRSVLVDLVKDDAPASVRAEAVQRIRELIRLQHDLTGRDVIVIPLLVASGSITRQKLPADLAGLPIRYSGEALVPHPAMARWIESRVRETLTAPLSQSQLR